MALINCPECGKEVSDSAGNCLNCGYKILISNSSFEKPQGNAKTTQMLKIVVISLAAVFFVGWFIMYNAFETMQARNAANTRRSQSSTYSSSTYKSEKDRALDTALLYLRSQPFSRSGLIEQLEYEKYSSEAATYAADHCGADWDTQAKYKAAQYLSFSSFSRQRLIEQLEYEGFTHSEAVYGVNSNGL